MRAVVSTAEAICTATGYRGTETTRWGVKDHLLVEARRDASRTNALVLEWRMFGLLEKSRSRQGRTGISLLACCKSLGRSERMAKANWSCSSGGDKLSYESLR